MERLRAAAIELGKDELDRSWIKEVKGSRIEGIEWAVAVV
jgi:hypothetical protein